MLHPQKNFVRPIMLSIIVALSLTAANRVLAQNDTGCETAACRKDVAQARAATAKYHDFSVALAEGFVPVSPCVEVPGLGAMGIHFLNFSRFDLTLNPAEPELLLYLPDADGDMELVGLEYAAASTGSNPPPVLFGQTLQGPVSHGGPPQYELHVWAWKHNPGGMFSPFNSKLRCPAQ